MPALRLVFGLGSLLLALGIGTAAASAATAYASSTANIRSGAGPAYPVVGVLRAGQRVDVDYCRGTWCVIDRRGRDGWVNANYLTAHRQYYDRSDDGYDYDDSDGYIFGRRGFADDYFFEERPRPRYRLYPVHRTQVCWRGNDTTLCLVD